MARTNQTIKLYRGNALTVANGSVVKTPDVGLYYGEIAINANGVDPTIYIGKVTNATIDDTEPTALLTDLAEFKSKAWMDANIIGGTPKSAFNTITKISTYLSYLFGDAGDGTGASVDVDAVINTWGEVKTFLASIPEDDNYTLMSMLNSKASLNFTIASPQTTSVATLSIVGNGTTATATFEDQDEEPFEIGSTINVSNAVPSGLNGRWVVLSCSKNSVTWSSTVNATATTQGTIEGAELAEGYKLYDDTTIKATSVASAGSIPNYSKLYVNLTAALGAGSWDAGTWTAGTLTTRTQGGSDVAIAASEVESFYNEFHQMFTLIDGKIMVNLDFSDSVLDWTKIKNKPTALSAFNNDLNYVTESDLTGVFQPYDADLSSIAGLSGTSGLLRKTAANTWTLDTNIYLTGITSSQVTTALGFTPYNSTNPNGYVSEDDLTGVFQPYSAVLSSISSLGTANSMIYASSANTYAAVTTSSFGRSILNATSGTVFSGLYSEYATNAGSAATLTTARTFAIAGSTGLTATAASFNGSANVSLTLAGTLTVGNGGTGVATLAAGCALIGNGTSAVATRAITDNTTATAVAASTNLITANTLYYHKGNTNLTTLGTITTGVWNGTVINPTYGGTGVNNGSKTITLGGNMSTAGAVSFTGAFALALAVTAATSLTLPTSGTLLSTDSVIDCGTF